ncbi:MAG: hypothetical protein ACYC25_07940 [Paludibacter sp.]|jgi:hypothetical protein
MSSTSETGHAKNVANWFQLTNYAISYGTDYNPSKPALKIPALQSLGDSAQNSLSTLSVAQSAFKNTTAAREVTFDGLSPLVTRAMNTLKASDSTKQVDDNAKTIARKIQGQRAKAKTTVDPQALPTEGETTKEISSSQRSYDNLLANFGELITLFESIPEYNPNEEELKTTALRAYYTELKSKNDAAVAATIESSNARIARNNVLYKPLTGLVDLSVDVKNYVKAIYGASSPQYKQISKLVFKAIKI